MKSSDLVLFRDICDCLDERLYQTIQNPDDDFISDVENGYKFTEYSSCGVEYDFDDIEYKLNVKLRYYQRMALYFTKYYFDKKYLLSGNENNKLTYWMATGSGKTVIMKANIIDYFEYLKDKNPDEIEVIITSPLKELIGQLQKEMSEFFTHPFFRDFKFCYKIETTQGLISQYENESHEIVGENQYRLLLVDEAHIGLGSKDKGAFVNIRNELTKNISNSFMFEYSATFYDIKDKEQINDYANRIIYEYDYGKFYNDRYGKDFKFDVIKKDTIAEDESKDIKRNLDANLKAFNEKLNAFNDYNTNSSINRGTLFPNRPLLIMAGNTVSASKEVKSDNEENSDISKIIDYLAKLDDSSINKYINIFNENKGVLHLLQNSSNEGEVLMAFGEDAIPFGLITVGDVKKFLENKNIQTMIANGKIITKAIKFTDENYLFKNIDDESSPINILIGSRKFSAGWNSFRASQICLINFGTGSGPTIIQMFGRGVRLRGLNSDGKRSEKYYVKEDEIKSEFLSHSKDNVTSEKKYELLKHLETLFIYSLRSTYLSKFVEEDTDIYKKSLTLTKDVEIKEVHQDKSLPIFYVDKSKIEIYDIIEVDTLSINDKSLVINYTIDKIKNNTHIELPLNLDLTVEKENTINFDEIKWLENFIDKAYIENLIHKKLVQAKINIEVLSLSYIIELVKSKKVIIKYDGEISSPKQFQKLIIKIANTLISKIKNKISYNETKQNYNYTKSITNEDYIDRYDVKFILSKTADIKKVSDRLEKDDSYKMFIDKVVNHYYQPLAIDPHGSSKHVFETYQECLNLKKPYTENHKNILDYDDEYFADIEEVKVTPDKLNPDEFKFVCDLQKYISENNLNVTILRNKSKGNIGLISNDNSGVFYPDFILWYTQKLEDKKEQQHIIFCDPKGIRNPETKWKVCDAPYYIKELESDKEWNSNIKLHSFIVSNTPKKDIVWSPIDNLDFIQCDLFFNLVFQEEPDYIKRIFAGINQDIKVHQHFMKYLSFYDKNILDEWLDDKNRADHLKNIESISELNDIELSKRMLLYFLIYKNRDKLKEEIFDDTKEEIKSHIIDEILPEALSVVLPGGKILFKTSKWLYKRYKT
jgi:hypothetical protein